jgi:hypothetical protein
MGQATRTDARIRVVIAETTFVKSAMVRHRLENGGFDVFATPADGVVEQVRSRQPDALVLGRGLIDPDGPYTLDAIREASPATKVVVVGPSGAVAAEGTDGYLEEQASVDLLAHVLIDLCGEPTIVLPGAADVSAETVPMAALLAGGDEGPARSRRDRRAFAGRVVIAFGAGLIVISLIAMLGSSGGQKTAAPAAAASPNIGTAAGPGTTPTSLDKAYATLDDLVAALRTGNYIEAKVDAGLLIDLRQQATTEGFALLALDTAITEGLTPVAQTIAPRVATMMEDILGPLWPIVEQPAAGTGGGDGSNIITSGGTNTGSSSGSGTGTGTGTGTGGSGTGGGGSGGGGSTGGGGGGGGTDTFPGQGSHAGWTHKPPNGGWHGDKPK